MLLAFVLSTLLVILAFPMKFNLLFKSYYMPYYSKIKVDENRRISRKEISEDKQTFFSMVTYILIYLFVFDFAIIYAFQYFKFIPITYISPIVFSYLLQKYYRKRISKYTLCIKNAKSL